MRNLKLNGAILLGLCILIPSISMAQVGINTQTPHPDSILELKSSDKGFLPSRVKLSSLASPAPLSTHVEGMIVYNTATSNDVTPGLYINDGTKWGKFHGSPDEPTDTIGSVLHKQKYRGRNLDTNGYNKPTLKVSTMNMEFRFATTSGETYLEVRLLTAPTANVTYYANELWFGSTTNGGVQSIIFTPTNWNVWSRGFSNGVWNKPWGYQYQISTKDGVIPGSNDLKAGNFYGFNNYGNGAGAENEMFVLAFEQY